MGDHLGNDGKLPTINYAGRDLKVAYYCPKVSDLVEKEIARLNIETALELADVDPGIVAETRKLLRKRSHTVGGELWANAFETQLGATLVLWACINANHPDFSVDDAKKLLKEKDAECTLLFELVLPSFFGHISTVIDRPAEILMSEFQKRRATRSQPTEASTSV